MKKKELRKLLTHFLKLNQSLVAAGQKCLTGLQVEIKIIIIDKIIILIIAKIIIIINYWTEMSHWPSG